MRTLTGLTPRGTIGATRSLAGALRLKPKRRRLSGGEGGLHLGAPMPAEWFSPPPQPAAGGEYPIYSATTVDLSPIVSIDSNPGSGQ